ALGSPQDLLGRRADLEDEGGSADAGVFLELSLAVRPAGEVGLRAVEVVQVEVDRALPRGVSRWIEEHRRQAAGAGKDDRLLLEYDARLARVPGRLDGRASVVRADLVPELGGGVIEGEGGPSLGIQNARRVVAPLPAIGERHVEDRTDALH